MQKRCPSQVANFLFPLIPILVWLKPFYYYSTGADPGFFSGGGAPVSCSTSTPINPIVFFGRIPVVLENRRSSQGGGGCAPPAPSP